MKADHHDGLEATLAQQESRLPYHAQEGFITARTDLMSLAQIGGLSEFAIYAGVSLGVPRISTGASLQFKITLLSIY